MSTLSNEPVLTALPCRADPSESEATRAFLQERIAYFARMVLVLAAGFYVLGNLIQLVGHPDDRAHFIQCPHNILHLVSCAVLGGIWWYARRGVRPQRALWWVDMGGAFVVCSVYAALAVGGCAPKLEYQAVLAVTYTLVARSILVPSTPGQTLWLGIACMVPTVTACYLVLVRAGADGDTYTPALSTAFLALWCAVAVVLSAVTSRVTYGLRREVREARRLGQYTLEERIGGGGMGEVYRASHALLRRPTAVKLLRCDLAGESSIARFEREVQLTSRLTHPNTISIFDYGRTPEGIFYYAMEYLPGITLDDLIRQDGPQPSGRVIHILRQVCGSLGEAHSIGLIHRDIKGANVILCERGGIHDVAKLVDFGLVKDLEKYSEVTLSGANVITGTPLYMSPESLRTPDRVDARSDIYAVGVLGYFLLTGKHVFEGQNFVEICGHHLHTLPVPPSLRVGSPLPADLEQIVLRCLEKDPDLRPRDARELSGLLASCRNAFDWSEDRAREWWTERGAQVRSGRPSTDTPTVASSGGSPPDLLLAVESARAAAN